MLVGVCGAGTMGLGIAQLAPEVVVWDPAPDARERAAAKDLRVTADLADLAQCDVVIEAAPEDLELKRDLFAQLEELVSEDCVLATNTSSLLVTAIAGRARRPERVVGMHFFNPPTKMRLVEVVAGVRSGAEALERVSELARAMDRTPVVAKDGPGFIVNRCNRPFNLEALRCLADGLASHEQIDRIMRLGGGFRMGAFELMDLVGLDTTIAVQKSFYEQSFGEPRWRPSPLVARMVEAGRLGRKTEEGWYAYPRERRDEPPASAAPGERVVIAGETQLAAELAEAAAEAGWSVATPGEEVAELILDCGHMDDEQPLQGAPQVILCDAAPLALMDPGGASVGFYALPHLGDLVELTRSVTSSETAVRAAERFFASIGRHVEWVADAPGLVLGRIVAQLVNEAHFALGDGVAGPDDIDTAMTLGLNHPRGPFEWMEPQEALTIVRALHDELGDDRYRPAPELIRAARTAAFD